MKEIQLGSLYLKKGKSLNPKNFPSETFEYYSIPAYDNGSPEIIRGENIGSSKKLLKEGDVVLSRIVPHIRRCWVIPNIGNHRKIGSGEWIVFRSDVVDNYYLRFYLMSDLFNRQFMKTIKGVGGSLMRADPKQVARFQIPLPPLPEQKRIAAILDAADTYRQQTQALIGKYEELGQSLFLEMFGDPVRNEMGWEKVLAGDNIDLTTGYPFKSAYYSKKKEDIRLCGGLILMPWGIEWDKANRWDKTAYHDLEKYWLKIGDIVMAMDRPWINSGFKIAIIKKEDVPSLLVQRTARIRSNSLNQTFLFFLYKNVGFKRHSKPTETTVPHISPKDIRSYNLINPPLNLQNQFADRIQAIEAQKALAEKSMVQAENLFQSLLQQAFRGGL